MNRSMDIRKYVLMMGVGMILMGCGAGRSRSEGFLGRDGQGGADNGLGEKVEVGDAEGACAVLGGDGYNR